ncbi:MAG: Fic family protein [Burkholderiaceae bacterium]
MIALIKAAHGIESSSRGQADGSANKGILTPNNPGAGRVKPLEKFFTESPKWHEKIGAVHALLERVKISEEQSNDVLHLRKCNRILSVHASTAIEGNQLTLGQVTDVINGKSVWGPPKDIKEVQNAWDAYNAMPGYTPWSVDDLLRAHAHLTDSLIGESGRFRSGGVAVVGIDGTLLHRGALSVQVPKLVEQLLQWGETSEVHPLIKSSAVHYRLEYIHPFRDGNGRIGRLWQTLILSQWNPLFAWMPMETLVHHNQALYYKALQDSHAGAEVDCRPFIDFMLDIIANSLYKYIDVGTQTLVDVPVNVPVNVPVKDLTNKILTMVRANPKVTAQNMALALRVTDKTIKRHLKALREQGYIQRVGSDRAGHWEIIEKNVLHNESYPR